MKKLLILLTLIIGVSMAFALVSEYTFAQSTQTYTEITGGTLLSTGAIDDNQYTIALPFAFSFNGAVVTTGAMSSNGYLSFGAGTNNFGYVALSSANSGIGVIATLNTDLLGGTAGEMRWQLFGTAPNQYAVYQWKNYRSYYGTNTDDWNFQVILYETTNQIAIRYGAFTCSDTYFGLVQVGMRGSTNADFINRTTSTDWAATTQGATNDARLYLLSTVQPPNGLQFLYAPPVAITVPNSAGIVSPAAEATGVSLIAGLAWTNGDSFPTGYKVYLDTVNPPTTLVSTQAGVTYSPATLLAFATDYYWQIVPYNAIGEAVGCPVWHFTTGTASDVNMTNGSTNIPLGYTVNFYDTGGAAGDYQCNESYTYTFNAVAGNVIQAVFSYFAAEEYWDYLYAYDGASSSAALIGSWSGSGPTTITSTGTAMTFVFTSDTSFVGSGWAAVISNLSAGHDVPAGIDTPVNGITINSTIDLNLDPAVTNADPILMALPAYNAAGSTVMAFNGTGIGDLTVSVPAGTWYLGLYDGTWHWSVPNPFTGAGTYTFIGINYGAKADAIVLLSPVDPTLPVELSSFTAVLTADYFVNLQWVTESETQVLGFNVYRSETADVADAIRVNPAVIAATNTSEQHTYSISDREVQTNATYYYWLENVDMGGGNALHGPQTVTVTGNPVPVLPVVSMLSSAYPNPFRSGSNTKINVAIKAGETGNVTVYNVRGQLVKSFSVQEGTHTLNWDGKNCGSGVYFYRLTTPTLNSTRKLAIVK